MREIKTFTAVDQYEDGADYLTQYDGERFLKGECNAVTIGKHTYEVRHTGLSAITCMIGELIEDKS